MAKSLAVERGPLGFDTAMGQKTTLCLLNQRGLWFRQAAPLGFGEYLERSLLRNFSNFVQRIFAQPKGFDTAQNAYSTGVAGFDRRRQPTWFRYARASLLNRR